MSEHLYLKPLPEDDGIIEMTMERIPRWKESELSGDEWRYTMVSTIRSKNWENGEILEDYIHGKDFAQMALKVANRLDEMLSYGNQQLVPYVVKAPDEIKVCFQPGCGKQPVNVYAIKQNYSWFPYQGHKTDEPYGGSSVRAFCKQHSHRGDCDLEDSDDNYELIAYFPEIEMEDSNEG